MKANAERLWQMLMEMAKIGATDKGGNTRLALSDEDVAGRSLLIEWAKKINLSIHYDEIATLILRRAGLSATALPIVMGSHLDTQPKGGRFDGIYGVLAGLEVLQRLSEEEIKTYHPLEVVVWTNEEGARFTPAMMSSAVFTGLLSKQKVYESTDKQGVTVSAQIMELPYFSPFGHQTTAPAAKLAAKLAEHAPEGLNHVFFGCGGSVANDTAVRLIHHYFHQIGQPSKKKLIARKDAYHGSTYISMSLTGIEADHIGFEIHNQLVHHVSCPNPYR